MEHDGPPKTIETLQDENVTLAKELRQTEIYYKRMVAQRDTAIHKLNIEENTNTNLRFKFVATHKKAERLKEENFELKMKNADLVLALNKATEKNKTLTAQIADLFSAGEETLAGEKTLAISPPSSPIPNSVEKRSKKEGNAVSPPSSPIPNSVEKRSKKEGNGTPEKPDKRTLSNKRASAKRRRSSRRLERLLSTS